MSTGTWILAVGLFAVAYAILIFNRLISLRNEFSNAFSQVDVQLQRRYELIPNLVEIASTYLQHEKSTLVAVTEARNTARDRCREAAARPTDKARVGKLADAERALGGALGSLNLVMENYPDLQADERLSELHRELASTENRIAFARQAYSDAVMQYNTGCEQFPALIVARLFAFAEADLFSIDSEEYRKPVKVSFA